MMETLLLYHRRSSVVCGQARKNTMVNVCIIGISHVASQENREMHRALQIYYSSPVCSAVLAVSAMHDGCYVGVVVVNDDVGPYINHSCSAAYRRKAWACCWLCLIRVCMPKRHRTISMYTRSPPVRIPLTVGVRLYDLVDGS